MIVSPADRGVLRRLAGEQTEIKARPFALAHFLAKAPGRQFEIVIELMQTD